ncbi:MAG: ion transporter [Planctomycetes bacterium]|nr:ion transporter [Planctomycetota bacterium]
MTAHALPGQDDEVELERGRSELLARVERALEWPMLVLGLAWVALIAFELGRGLGPSELLLFRAIWGVFIAEFLLRLLLAPRRIDYLRRQWLTGLSLVIPAIRIGRAFVLLRALRSVRVTRAVRLAQLLTATNRGTRALGRTMQRRGLKYVLAATALVTLLGAAGMLAFESEAADGAFHTYGEALWYTAMLITTIASERWPQTLAGRILSFLLSVYAMAVLGYIAAALASHFVGHDAEEGERRELTALNAQLAALREEVRALSRGGPP